MSTPAFLLCAGLAFAVLISMQLPDEIQQSNHDSSPRLSAQPTATTYRAAANTLSVIEPIIHTQPQRWVF